MKQIKTIHGIKVVMEAETTPLKKGLQKAKAETASYLKGIDAEIAQKTKEIANTQKPIQDASSVIKGYTTKIKEFVNQAQLDAGVKQYTEDFKELHRNLNLTEKSLDELNKRANEFAESDKVEMSDEFRELEGHMQDAKKRMESLVAEKKKLNDLGVNSNDSLVFKNLQDKIQDVAREMSFVQGEMDDMKANGLDKVETKKWKNITESIRLATAEKERYLSQIASQAASGTHIQPAAQGFSSGSMIESGLTAAKAVPAEISATLSALKGNIIATKNRIAEAVKSIPFIGRMVTESSYLAKKGFSMISFAASKVGSGILKASGTAASLIKRFASGLPVIRKFTSALRQTGTQGKGLGGMLRMIGMSAKFMFANFVLMGAINAVKDGFGNLAKYSDETNQSLSLLKTQLAQLKNSLTTAFAPILNAVTPYLSQLIDYVIQATNALAQFFASLTGKSTYTVAKRVNRDFAGELDSTASSADKANKSAKNLQRTLLGFDEVNKLEDTSGNDVGASGTAGISPEDLFATESVNSQFLDFAKMVKEAWENADFTDIGKILGKKLNEGLASILWEEIKETARRIAKSIATFLNGFIGETDWRLAGKSFAEGINTIIDFGYTFVTEFDWKTLGRAIADAVNGTVKNIDWAKAGKFISDGFKGVLNTFNVTLENVDWNQLGVKCGEFLTNIDWFGALVETAKLLVNAFIGLLEFGEGLLRTLLEGFQEVDWHKVASQAWELLKKAWEGIIKILDVSVSLMKVGWETIVKFVGDMVDVTIRLFKDGWDNLSSFVGDKVITFIELAKRGWSTIRDFVGNAVEVGIRLGKLGWSKITDWLGVAKEFVLKFKLPKIKVNWGEKTIAGFTIKYPNGFSTYAQGGFPEEGPFMMNRGEIAGKFSNGKGVVANNQQITTGIANAVGPAVYNAVMAAMRSNGGQGQNITITLKGDAKGLFKVIKAEAENYMESHGTAPFPV